MPSYQSVYNMSFWRGNNKASAGQVTFDDSGVSYSGTRKSFMLKSIQDQFTIPAAQVASIIPKRPNVIIVVSSDHKRYPFRFGTTFLSTNMPNIAGMPGPSIVPGGVVTEAFAQGVIDRKNEQLLDQVCQAIGQTQLGSKLKPVSGIERSKLAFVGAALLVLLVIIGPILWARHEKQVYNQNIQRIVQASQNAETGQ
jgi:hypothetical protein